MEVGCQKGRDSHALSLSQALTQVSTWFVILSSNVESAWVGGVSWERTACWQVSPALCQLLHSILITTSGAGDFHCLFYRKGTVALGK